MKTVNVEDPWEPADRDMLDELSDTGGQVVGGTISKSRDPGPPAAPGVEVDEEQATDNATVPEK